jgi:hypothetical protein
MLPTSRIYVFQLDQRPFLAYSVDRTGPNIPSKPGDTWLLRGTIASLDIDLSEDRLLQLGQILVADGYYFLRLPERLLASEQSRDPTHCQQL